MVQNKDKSPLLSSRVTIEADIDNNDNTADGTNNASYGATDHQIEIEHAARPSSPSPSAPIHRDHGIAIVNHGHPYSDTIVDTVILENNTNTTRDDVWERKGKVTYWSLIKENENFRWYLMSYLVTHAGEWFTYVASLSAIEQIHASHNTTSRTSISILVSLRLLPNAFFTSIGGVLADSYDRRTIMWTLDILGSLVALLFLLAYHFRSITALYATTALQMTVAAIYEPSRSAIVSMLVKDEESLKKAVTISELAWSVMTSFGSSMGGFAAGYFGISMCFYIDSLSYFISALFVWQIKGKYLAAADLMDEESNAAHNDDPHKESSAFSLSQCTRMFNEGIRYLKSKPWGAFVFFKFCAALIYGAADVLNVSFSERTSDKTVNENVMEGSSQRLGVLFAFVGIGCFLGPVIIDHFTHMDQVKSLERACCGSFILMAAGCYGLSQVESFFWVCAFTAVRSAGSSIVWVQSSLLLQKFSSGSMLGRVMSVDYALATLGEAFSAMCGGILQDDAGLSAEQVSFLEALVALAAFSVWVSYLVKVRL